MSKAIRQATELLRDIVDCQNESGENIDCWIKDAEQEVVILEQNQAETLIQIKQKEEEIEKLKQTLDYYRRELEGQNGYLQALCFTKIIQQEKAATVGVLQQLLNQSKPKNKAELLA